MSDKPQRLFISYAHQDKALVTHVVELLRAGGHIPWSDHQLMAGQHWKRALRDEIERCDVFIYVLTPKSITSEWCQWEFYEALKLGKPVVPVMMRKASLTDALNYIQHVDFTGNHESRALATAQLIRAVTHAEPTLIGDEISLNFPDPSGPPEYLIGTAGFTDSQAGLPTNIDEDTQSRKASGYMPVSERQSAQAGGKRPPLFWWGIVALVAVIAAVLIRANILTNPSIPQSTVLTEVPTSIIIVPTIGFTDTAIIETPETKLPAVLPSVVSTSTDAAPPTEESLPTTADEGSDSDAGISTPIPVVARVKENSVNIRSGPSSNFHVIQIASKNDEFTIIAQSADPQSNNDWLLIALSDGGSGWIFASLVTLSDAGALIPYAATLPASPRPKPTNTPMQVCNPGQWIGVCGSNNCGTDYVSQCNSDGTGYTCVWNPQQCTVDSGPGSIFRPPRRPTSVPGDPTEEPFVCTNGWLTGQLQAYANNLGISLQQLIQQLLPSYDLDHDGDIDCDDYNKMNGG